MKSKKKVIALLTGTMLLTGCLFGVPVMAAEQPANTITVNGEGTIEVEPDLAYVYVGVSTSGVTAKEAQDQNSAKMTAVQSALIAMGIGENDIKSNYVSVYPEYSYNQATGEQTITGYTATHMLEVKTTDVDHTADIIDTALRAGANRTDGVSFTLSNPNLYYGDALKLAVSNAGQSANAIAGALGVTIQSPVSVIENTSSGVTRSYNASYAMEEAVVTMDSGSAASAPITYDEIEVTARIEVTYQY